MKARLAERIRGVYDLPGLMIPFMLFPLGMLLRRIGADHAILAVCAGLLLVLSSQRSVSSRRRAIYSIFYTAVYDIEAILAGCSLFNVAMVTPLLILIGQRSVTLRKRIEEEHRQSTIESARRRQLADLNTRLLTVRGMDDIQQQLLRAIFEVCGNSSVCFQVSAEAPAFLSAYPPGLIIYRWETQTVAECIRRKQIVGVGTSCCTTSSFRCYPIIFEGEVHYAVAVLLGVEEQDPAVLQFTDQLIQRGVVAMERQRLIDVQQEIIMEKQVEEVRANFLRAISHDLRSPLAAIIGACSALERVSGGSENDRRLLADIREESEWLTRMVENLLSVTRVNENRPKLNLSEEAVEEIVGEAAYKCKTRFPNLDLRVSVPNQVIILRMDATLITQVIINIIENAVKYSGDSRAVELSVACAVPFVVISIRDHGCGVPNDKLADLFSGKGPRGDDSRHGLGIGLSICRTIVSAHGGRIWVENCADGGACFSFTLPLEEEVHE